MRVSCSVLLLLALRVVFACQTGCYYNATVVNSTTIIGKYNGTVSVSVTGKTCCNWPASAPSYGIVAGTNYCRNYNDDKNVYCLIGDCTYGEYCDVGSFGCPICTNPTYAPTPAGSLTYPCIAPQALADTGDTFETRVVGGRNAIPHEFPFYVSIQRSGGVYCGGSLIHKDWVLTAQHCTYESSGAATSPSVYTIKIGLQNSTDTDACVETRTVTQIIRYPNYNSGTGRNDLAFFKLSASSNYPPIILNRPGLSTENLEDTGKMMTIIGHGTLRYGGTAALTLQKSTVPIYNQTTCAAFWNPNVDSTTICAAYQYGSVDTCQGDSGGPLFVKRGTNFIQIGTVAYGDGCANANSPGVYMRVSAFSSWLCGGSSGLPAEICTRSLGSASPTVPPTTRSPTTAKPTTSRPTTRSPTTKSPTTRAPTKSPTKKPTTRSPTTKSPTTRAPTKSPTNKPTTRSPTTKSPTTRAPTKSPTMKPTTRVPTTKSPTTRAPTKSPTNKPTTKSPTTRSPTTRAPTKSPTLKPTTRAPTTRVPTQNPTTKSPTLKPTTRAPTTRAPTQNPTTKSPTLKPTTRTPTTRTPTQNPTTKSPTLKPTTRAPTTRAPTHNPTTKSPTMKPTTRTPTTRAPTKAPTTKSPTMKPTTKAPTTRAPTQTPTTKSPTMKPTTKAPTTRAPTQNPTTKSPTMKPTTREPTLKPTTLAPTTKQPTLQPTTRQPTTRAPTDVSR